MRVIARNYCPAQAANPDAVVIPTIVPRSFREGNLRAYKAVKCAPPC